MSRKVLVVEDKADYRNMIASGLEHLGFTVVPVASVELALGRFTPCAFDCLVVDYNLSERTGIEFIREVRRKDAKVGVVMMTADDVCKVEDECEGLSVWAVCKKPVNVKCLASKIEDASELAHLSPETEERMSRQLEDEASRTRHLHSYLLNETDTFPAQM